MPNDRVTDADAIAAAYWASVARLDEKTGASDSVIMEHAEAETQRAFAVEQAREVERAEAVEDDETKRQVRATLRTRLRPRL